MSLENEDRGLSDKDYGTFDVDLEKPKISYSREFLLTLSKVDICKKLPIGFDESLLSELEYAPQGVSDRQKIPGSTPLHGFKRNEYESSPPTRKDFGSYPRNIYGKWESRSSGRSDRDSDSQSDKDSDSGKRYGPQPRRSWQSPPEHDGLLGSGSFPRPSGYAGGVSAPKVQTNGPHQLSKSTEPYQPPKPYKALTHPRRDTDAFNDETFGSAELTSEERAKEERKRRDSFEMMRKEQQKALQEKQKLGLDKAGCSGTPDLFEMLDKNNEKKGPVKNNDVGVPATTTISSNDIERASFGSNSPAIRPLIPPGFRNNVLDKTSGLTSRIPPHLSEVEKLETGENLKDTESRLLQNNNHEGLEWQLSQNMSLVDGQLSEKTRHTPLLSEGQNFSVQKDFNVPIRKLSMDDQNIVGVNASAIGDNSVADSNKSSSTSIFEKIFGNTSSASGSGFSSAELQGSKPDDIQSSKPVKSSIVLWFSEEESKAPNDTSFERPSDLLSLLASGNKSRNQVSDTETGDNLAQNHSYQNSELANKITPGLHSACSIVSNQVSVEIKEKAVPSLPALTCEDLEQSILSEYSVKTTDTQPLLKSRSDISAKLEEPSAKVNNNASVHLLSLLQKGKEHTNANPIFNLADKRQASLENDLVKVVNDPIREENIKNTPNLGDSVLGTDFMDAIKSAKAPVSITSGINQIGLQNPSKEYSGMISDNRQQIKLSNSESWLGFDDPHNVIASQMHHIGAVPKISGFEAVPHARLPEENLISVSDPRYHGMSMNMPTGNSSKNSKIALNAPLSINDKLAALSAAVNDERVMARSESLSFPRGPYGQMEPIQQSSQFQPPQLNQARPLYNQMQAHPRMKFLGTDPMLNYGSPANRRFPSNDVGPFHHSNVPAYHSMMPQMQMPGNHSPHLVPEFTSGPSSRHGNQPTALTHDINQMHGFPLGTRQRGPNHGVPMPGPNTNSGGPTPEAFQRLMEMEFHANSKQNHPFTHGRDAGMHGLR